VLEAFERGERRQRRRGTGRQVIGRRGRHGRGTWGPAVHGHEIRVNRERWLERS
jgi:hypothetical protein